MQKRLYTIAAGSRLGGHTTTVHHTVENLLEEINSTLADDNDMIQHIIGSYNEMAEQTGFEKYEGSVGDFDFAFIMENDKGNEGGWSWGFDHLNAMGETDHSYLNITVHEWRENYFESLS